MKCFYHNDNDGKAAAFCVHAWVGLTDNIQPVFIAMDYGKAFPFESIRPGEQVWIVDYSIAPDDMRRLLKITSDVTWIDHHKTAIEKYANFPERVAGFRCDGVAACVLAFQYIHWYSKRGSEPAYFNGPVPVSSLADAYPVPRVIEIVGDWDVWAFKHGEETRRFHAASGAFDTSPMSDFWWLCMNCDVDPLPPPNTGNAEAKRKGDSFWSDLQAKGAFLIDYHKRRHSELREAIAFECEFEGHRCLAMNLAKTNSEAMGGDESFKRYPILIPFFHDGNQFSVSLYSKTVDVSEIAKRHGGGGHKGASGFQCSELPFKKGVS